VKETYRTITVVFYCQKNIFYLKGSKKSFYLWFWQYGKDKKNVLKQCQSNWSTNHAERGVVLQTPKQIWLDGHQLIAYINIYLHIDINTNIIFKLFFFLWKSSVENNFIPKKSPCESDKNCLKKIFLVKVTKIKKIVFQKNLLVICQGEKKCKWHFFSPCRLV